MRLLLDTHALLWWLDRPSRLSREAHRAIEDGANDLFVSSATVWEIAIKARKLRPRPDLPHVLARIGFAQLVVTWDHASEVMTLPFHHGDPFDRLLIAQARVEGLTIVTRDPAFDDYAVATLPA